MRATTGTGRDGGKGQGERREPRGGTRSVQLVAGLAAAGALALAGPGAAAEGRTAPPDRVQVELAMNAERASWRPSKRGSSRGKLVLDGVAARMAVMAVAPRREATVLPAGMLLTSWSRLFGHHGRTTNIVVSYEVGGRRHLAAMRARLIRHTPGGRQVEFAIRPLRHTGRRPPRLPAGREVRDVTVLVDPSITDAVTAFWNKLVDYLTGPTVIPPDPTYLDRNNQYNYDGSDFAGASATWDASSLAIRDRVQRSVLDAAGPWSGTLKDTTFTGAAYDGLAIFNRLDEGSVTFAGTGDARMELSGAAVFNSVLSQVRFTDVNVEGLTMRGTDAGQLNISGTAMEAVDLTGGRFRGGRVENSVLERTVSNRIVTNEGVQDAWSNRATGDLQLAQVDFVSTRITESDFPRAVLSGTTFQGCELTGVDLSNATIRGADSVQPGETFRPTFDGSVLSGVNFDGARLTNVSFNGTDFSGGGVSLNGAVLSNVDFTGATGLQDVDWTTVEFSGPVYGLWEVSTQLDLGGKEEYLRSFTEEGVRPTLDFDTGYDVMADGLLLDPQSGVRFQRDENTGSLIPWDPVNERPLSAYDGEPLSYDASAHALVDDRDLSLDYHVDYQSGEIE